MSNAIYVLGLITKRMKPLTRNSGTNAVAQVSLGKRPVHSREVPLPFTRGEVEIMPESRQSIPTVIGLTKNML